MAHAVGAKMPAKAAAVLSGTSSEMDFLDSPAGSLVSLRNPACRHRPTLVPRQAQGRRMES